jgi:hypothetical protein
MMVIVRVLLFIAALITALFVTRDALNFGVMQTLIAVILIAAVCLGVAFWKLRQPIRKRLHSADLASSRTSPRIAAEGPLRSPCYDSLVGG